MRQLLRVPQPGPVALAEVGLIAMVALAHAAARAPGAGAQACPPYCPTPIITPSWHLHMCDQSYEAQLEDNHCMVGPGITEFASGTDRVHVIYCHQFEDTVVLQIRDSGGGLQFVNHPDGVTYEGNRCDSEVWWPRFGIPSGGSPYITSVHWPEGPFSGIGAGIEWYIGLFVAFDQEDYYGNDAEALITARDPAANLNPTVRDTITVHVASTSDPAGIRLELREELPSFPLFKLPGSLRFSQLVSDEAQAVIQVADHDTITVTYCPRDCRAPYVDSATWYQRHATITPTPLPTWPGPPPTLTPTPPPELDVDYVVLRPAPADVGYVPQVSTHKDRPNHLGYPSIYAGTWTRGTNRHYGMAQFDLSPIPAGASILDARLEMVGRESRFVKPGAWSIKLLGEAIDSVWRGATFESVDDAPVVADVGLMLTAADVAVGRVNTLGFDQHALDVLNARLSTTRRLSLRVDGPGSEENNLFAWQSGVDVYRRDREPPDPMLGPQLHLAYSLADTPDEPTPTRAVGGPTESPTRSTPSAVPSASPTATASTPGSGPTTGPGASSTPSPSTTATLRTGPTGSPPDLDLDRNEAYLPLVLIEPARSR